MSLTLLRRTLSAGVFAALCMRAGALCAESLPSAQTRGESSASSAAPATAAAGTAEKVLTRSAFVRAVLASNPSIDVARQGVRAALARERGAGAFEDPMLDFGLAPLSLGSTKARPGYEIGIRQELPWFGKRGLERDALAADAAAARSDFEAMRRALAMSAVTLYDQYYVLAHSLDINAHHVALMREMQESALGALEAGRASAQDSLQAEAELARMADETLGLAADRDVVVAQMNELLQRAPESPLPPPVRELSLRSPASPLAQPQLQEQAARARPEIDAARQRAQAEQKRAAAAELAAFPNITLSASYNSMWDMPEHRWMLGIGISLPLQSGPRAARADEARALRASFESEATRLTDAAKSEVFVALRRLAESEQRLLLFERRLLPIARDQIDAARAGFVASQSPFSAVVQAEKNLRAVELEYQTARADCDRRQAELARALGLIPGLESAEVAR